MVGATIAHYKVLEKLGEGGMGEVYRAHDTKLNRDVALKILPQVFAQDSQRMARFEREAQVLASLNHPHVAQIYGLEETDGTKALVLELVEGETLQEQMARGPIPVDEALKIALQICEGLEAAHEKGIIHRDLKPANIKITPEGQVKILDFGLAKALEGETPVSDLSNSPTITHAATQAGVILGTASYMSPEQARGQPVDKRTDIWAFGCVLYEMLTGTKAFGGAMDETVSDVLASVLKGEPDWVALPENTSVSVAKLLRRCLNRELPNRLHDIADVRIELLDADPQDRLTAIAPEAPRSLWLLSIPWIISLLCLILLATTFWMDQGELPSPRLPILTSIALPGDAPLAPSGVMSFGVGRPSLALSSDGRYLVYLALRDSKTQLHLRDMMTGEVEALKGTEGAHTPVFSPDNEWIAFLADEKLQKVPRRGGTPIALADVSSADHGVTWGSDGWIYYNPNESQGLWRASPDGTKIEEITTLGSEYFHGWPEILPRGSGLLLSFNEWRGIVAWQPGFDGQLEPLLVGASFPRVTPTGHLVYASKGRLMAVPFDDDALEVSGSPTVLFENLRTEGTGGAQFSFSQEGTLVLAPGRHQTEGSFVWLDREGRRTPLDLGRRGYGNFKLSPDGNHLALTLYDEGRQHLLVRDLRTGVENQLTSEGINRGVVWSPDGRVVVYNSGIQLEVRAQPVDRSWEPVRLAEGFFAGVFSSADQFLVNDGNMIMRIGLDESDGVYSALNPEKLKEGQFGFPSLSPDGNWLTYTGFEEEKGSWEIYVSPYPNLDRKYQISDSGGEEPLWNSNGEEIIYRSARGGTPGQEAAAWGTQWYSVSVSFDSGFSAGAPKVLFEGPYINVAGVLVGYFT